MLPPSGDTDLFLFGPRKEPDENANKGDGTENDPIPLVNRIRRVRRGSPFEEINKGEGEANHGDGPEDYIPHRFAAHGHLLKSSWSNLPRPHSPEETSRRRMTRYN